MQFCVWFIRGLIGSHKVHEKSKIINRIVVAISTVPFLGSTLVLPGKPKIGNIIIICLFGVCNVVVLSLWRYKRSKKTRKEKTKQVFVRKSD